MTSSWTVHTCAVALLLHASWHHFFAAHGPDRSSVPPVAPARNARPSVLKLVYPQKNPFTAVAFVPRVKTKRLALRVVDTVALSNVLVPETVPPLSPLIVVTVGQLVVSQTPPAP